MKQISFGLAAFASSLMSACATLPSKDIHYRSRLPTQEIPMLALDEDDQWGVDVDLENNRFTFQPTNNLVNNYSMGEDTHYFSSNQDSIAGADVAGTYRRTLGTVPAKIAFSFDFAEVQINPFADFKSEWFTNINVGAYKTAAFISNGSDCNFLCFGGNGNDSDLKEKEISTTQEGREGKIGFQIGRLFKDKYAVAFSLNHMNYEYDGSATKPAEQRLHFHESFWATGTGLGFFYIPAQVFNFGFTVDSVAVNWRGSVETNTVVGLRTKLAW